MERLIQSGHGIIFATTYGYLDDAISRGEKYPDVAFLHAGGLKTSANVGTYWADATIALAEQGIESAEIASENGLDPVRMRAGTICVGGGSPVSAARSCPSSTLKPGRRKSPRGRA